MRSELCIYDLETESVRLVLTIDGHVEAPNWHPEGSLVVNGDGLLFRVPLDDPRLDPVDTGFATGLNNDHGLSPDGTRIALSDKTEDGQSAIYVADWPGGVPRRAVGPVPSWWHGWSPDGRVIAYAGARGDRRVSILLTDLDSGAETRLTGAEFDHADGPDFSADGQWVWFNGERDGAVDLWRVRPDGGDLQRMTDDDKVNWFPHPSPDGQHVLYLAYPAGTQGHPGGLDVTLCLMPQGGGPSRPVVTLFGGQGTINVPCWAPDSRAFAFMRFAD